MSLFVIKVKQSVQIKTKVFSLQTTMVIDSKLKFLDVNSFYLFKSSNEIDEEIQKGPFSTIKDLEVYKKKYFHYELFKTKNLVIGKQEV